MDFSWIFDTPIDFTREHSARIDRNHQALRMAVIQLARDNGELRLALAAVIRILLQKGVCTLPELSAIMDATDMEDGILDGQLRGRALAGQRKSRRPEVSIPQRNQPAAKIQPRPKPPEALKRKLGK